MAQTTLDASVWARFRHLHPPLRVFRRIKPVYTIYFSFSNKKHEKKQIKNSPRARTDASRVRSGPFSSSSPSTSRNCSPQPVYTT